MPRRVGRPRMNDKEALSKAVLTEYQSSAKQRSLGFDLTLREVWHLITSNCHYCGREPSRMKKRQQGKGYFETKIHGIDRVHNNFGYAPDNTVPCCYTCNTAKSDASYKEFLAWLDALVQFRTCPWIKTPHSLPASFGEKGELE